MNTYRCPRCGNVLTGNAAFCPHCGTRIGVANPVAGDKKSNAWLYVLISLLLAACLGVGSWLLFSDKEGAKQPSKGEPLTVEAKAKAQAQERTADEAASKTGEMADAASADNVPGQTSSSQQTAAPSRQPQSSEAGVYMGLWGQIGDSNDVEFEMNGQTGFYSYNRNGQASGRRTLRLVSYDPLSGRCIIDAFAQGKNIGKFDGTFTEIDEGDDEGAHHYGQSYTGKFISTNGAKLDFMLYFD